MVTVPRFRIHYVVCFLLHVEGVLERGYVYICLTSIFLVSDSRWYVFILVNGKNSLLSAAAISS